MAKMDTTMLDEQREKSVRIRGLVLPGRDTNQLHAFMADTTGFMMGE